MSHPNTPAENSQSQKPKKQPPPPDPDIESSTRTNQNPPKDKSEKAKTNNNTLEFKDVPPLIYLNSNGPRSIKVIETKIVTNGTPPVGGMPPLKTPSLVLTKGTIRPVVVTQPPTNVRNLHSPNILSRAQANRDRVISLKSQVNLKPTTDDEAANILKLLVKPRAPQNPEPSTSNSTNLQSDDRDMPMLLDLFDPPPLVATKQAMEQQNVKNPLRMKLVPSIIKKRIPLNTPSSEIRPVLTPQVPSTSGNQSNAKRKNPPQPTQAKPPKTTPARVQNKPVRERKANNSRITASKEETSKVDEKNAKADNQAKGTDRMDRKLENLYIADGLKEDCENLILKCLQVYKLNFEKFSEIWKQMSFSSIFHGRQSGVELAELSEEAIIVAKAYMVAKNVSFEENVAGLFIVYAFLNHQPYARFASLRLVPEDVPAVKALEREARRQRRYDVLYILGSVLIKGPCQYHVAPREVALEMPIRKYHDGSIHTTGRKHVGVLNQTRELGTLFKEIFAARNQLQSTMEMVEMKMGTKITATKPDFEELYHKYKSFVPDSAFNRGEPQVEEPKLAPPVTELKRQDLLSSIKQRAMETTVAPMRHLTGIEERQLQKATTSTSDAEDVRSPPYKGKGKGKGKGTGRSSAQTLQALFVDGMPQASGEGTSLDQGQVDQTPDAAGVADTQSHPVVEETPSPPVEDLTDGPSLNQIDPEINPSKSETKSPRKRKSGNLNRLPDEKTSSTDKEEQAAAKNTSKAKRKKKDVDTDSTGSDIDDIPLAELINLLPTLDNDTEQSDKMNLDNGTAYKPLDTTKIANPIESECIPRELPIDLDTIPEKHNSNKNGEVELIDKFAGKASKRGKAKTDRGDKIKRVSKKRAKPKNKEAEDLAKLSKFDLDAGSASDDPLIPAPMVTRKRTEKREYKRIRIKSKFKRLGMLGVANFDDSKDSGVE